jgi:hypothetical protein
VRHSVLVAALICLGASSCSSGGYVESIASPKDATGVMLSNRSAEQVATCMAGKLHTTAQQEAGAFTISEEGSSLRYRVHSIEDKLQRYTTQVDQLGYGTPADNSISTCLLGVS